MARLFLLTHLYCHLAAEGVPTWDGVPEQKMRAKLPPRNETKKKSYVHRLILFLSAPGEEKWCEQEASICRPRGVHRPQGQLREIERDREREERENNPNQSYSVTRSVHKQEAT